MERRWISVISHPHYWRLLAYVIFPTICTWEMINFFNGSFKVGHCVLLCTVVCSPKVKRKCNINSKLAKYAQKLLRQSSTTPSFINQDDLTVRWLISLRSFELRTADGLPLLPMLLSWVREMAFLSFEWTLEHEM